LVVLILLSDWDPPEGVEGYWYRNCVVKYPDYRVHPIVKDLVGAKEIAAIGAYMKGEKRDYSHLKPCFLKVSDVRIFGGDQYPFRLSIEFFRDYIDCPSSVFVEHIEELSQHYYCFLICDRNWEKLAAELDLKPPSWWEETRTKIITVEKLLRKFPRILIYKADDGHYVRSKAELVIDNWLYSRGIVHAYKWRLPTTKELFCDFYLPKLDIYIEHWEGEPEYEKRLKLQVYKEKNLRLVQLEETDIEKLEDVLYRKLADIYLKSHLDL